VDDAQQLLAVRTAVFAFLQCTLALPLQSTEQGAANAVVVQDGPDPAGGAAPSTTRIHECKKRDHWFFFSLARPHRTATTNHQKGGEADALLDGRAKAQLSYYEVTIAPPSAVLFFGWSGSPTTQQPTGELYRSSCAEQRPKAQGIHNELRLELEPPQQQQEEGKEDKSRRR
jgi:hypothetical protein